MGKVYSLDNEKFVSLEDVKDLIKDSCDTEFVYVGNQKEQLHSDFLDTDSMLEQMSHNAYDVADEYSYNYLEDITKEQRQELKEIVLDFLNKNVEKPTFFLVENVTKITLNEFNNIEIVSQ